ncbi:MAG: hypothetical protein K6C08_15660, partial [Oscillospiraceae bacterium]|nr:hypothetical protein [Oscillospiraceae bacterium]
MKSGLCLFLLAMLLAGPVFGTGCFEASAGEYRIPEDAAAAPLPAEENFGSVSPDRSAEVLEIIR